MGGDGGHAAADVRCRSIRSTGCFAYASLGRQILGNAVTGRPYMGNHHVRGTPARLSGAWRTGVFHTLFAFACAANQNLSTWVKSSKKHMPAVERHVCIVY